MGCWYRLEQTSAAADRHPVDPESDRSVLNRKLDLMKIRCSEYNRAKETRSRFRIVDHRKNLHAILQHNFPDLQRCRAKETKKPNWQKDQGDDSPLGHRKVLS